MFYTFEAFFKLRNLRKLHILRLRARSVICIKNRQNSQEGGTTFARHVQILPRHSLTNQKRFLCFNQEQITKELGPRVPQSPSLCPSCAKEKGSGVENGVQVFCSEHAHFKKCRPPNLMRMFSTENSYS